MRDDGEFVRLMELCSTAVDEERKKANANYIIHTMRLNGLKKVDMTNAEEVANRADDYLSMCVTDGIRPNLVGLALSFGTDIRGLDRAMCDRRMNADAVNAIGAGIAQVENVTISMMLDGRISPVDGIFLLKNHYGYRDQTDLNVRQQELKQDNSTQLEDKYRSVVEAIGCEEEGEYLISDSTGSASEDISEPV